MTATTAQTRVAHQTDKKKPRGTFRYRGAIAIFILPFAVIFLAFYLVPIIYAVYESLLKIQRQGTFGAPTEVFGGFSQYVLAFQDSDFWSSILRVLLFGVIQVPVMLALSLLFALLLDSPLLRGKRFFRLAFFAPYAVPGVIAAIMWGYLYSPSLSPFKLVTSNVDFLGGANVLWSIANVVTWVYVGYNMLIIYSSLLAIPPDLFEAAKLDGASQLRIAVSIKIPLVVPAIVLTAVFSIIGTLQLLTEPLVFRQFTSTVSSVFTPNMLVYATSSVPNFSLAAAFSVILAVATFILSIGFLRLTQRKGAQ